VSNPIDGDAVILKCSYKTVGQLANSSPMEFITDAKATT